MKSFFVRHRAFKENRSFFIYYAICFLVAFVFFISNGPMAPMAVAASAAKSVSGGRGAVEQIRSGTLERKEGSGWIRLTPGMSVVAGQTLRTNAGGVSIVQLPGQGRFVIGPSTEIVLGASERLSQLRLQRGAVWVDARLSRESRLTVATPTVVAGVRGTRFSVLEDSAGAAVCTCAGEVEVAGTDSAAKAPISSRTGQFVPVERNGAVPGRARQDRFLLQRSTGGRYDWCFTCHEIGGRGQLKRSWNPEDL